MKIHSLAALVLLGAGGCTGEPDTAHHTVEQYRTDRSLRQEVIAKCANDPGTLKNTPDCINAQAAQRLESTGSLRDSGPIGLDSKKKP